MKKHSIKSNRKTTNYRTPSTFRINFSKKLNNKKAVICNQKSEIRLSAHKPNNN